MATTLQKIFWNVKKPQNILIQIDCVMMFDNTTPELVTDIFIEGTCLS